MNRGLFIAIVHLQGAIAWMCLIFMTAFNKTERYMGLLASWVGIILSGELAVELPNVELLISLIVGTTKEMWARLNDDGGMPAAAIMRIARLQDELGQKAQGILRDLKPEALGQVEDERLSRPSEPQEEALPVIESICCSTLIRSSKWTPLSHTVRWITICSFTKL